MTVRDRRASSSLLPQTGTPVLVVAQLLPQLGELRDQAVLLDRVLDGDVERDLAESLGIVGLDDVVGGAEAHRLDDGRGLLRGPTA